MRFINFRISYVWAFRYTLNIEPFDLGFIKLAQKYIFLALLRRLLFYHFPPVSANPSIEVDFKATNFSVMAFHLNAPLRALNYLINLLCYSQFLIL